jgi:protein-S-isoprenylcysteine O-methyltransferase Ste14
VTDAAALCTGFDVRRGHQSAWTGVIGGGFLLGAYWGAALHGLSAPPVPRHATLLAGLPGPWRVSRDALDLVALLALTFQLMATWERAPARVQGLARVSLLLMAGGGVWSIWQAPATVGAFGLSGLEHRFLACGEGFLGLALLWTAVARWRGGTAVDTGAGPAPVPWIRAIRSGLARWLALLAVASVALAVYLGHRYYASTPGPAGGSFEAWRTTAVVLWLALASLGWPYAVWTVRRRRAFGAECLDPGLMLCLAARAGWRGRLGARLRNRRLRTALLDLLVKAFFLPLMVTFLALEAASFTAAVVRILDLTSASGAARLADLAGRLGEAWTDGPAAARGQALLAALIQWCRSAILLVDVGIGALGYAGACWWLDNKTRSVDPSLAGWTVTLVCYPPFNHALGLYLPYGDAGGPPMAALQTSALGPALAVVALVGYAVYGWATMAFGLRFSNLTHRGIITRGPYAWVRHPAYAAKNLAWWAEALPGFGTPVQGLYLLGWNLVYYARAVTEERHLARDPDYRTYCRAVPRRFIPGVW